MQRLSAKKAARIAQSSSSASSGPCNSAHLTASNAGHIVTGHSLSGPSHGW